MSTGAMRIDAGAAGAAARCERARPMRGWVLYDARCGLCSRGARLLGGVAMRRGYAVQPLQRAWVRRRLAMSEGELLRESRVLTAEGELYGGAAMYVHLARSVWWAMPLVWIAALPGGRRLLDGLYVRIARNRHCIGGSCGMERRVQRGRTTRRPPAASLDGLAGMIALCIGGFAFASACVELMPRWATMWATALSVYASLKAMTWRMMIASGAAGAANAPRPWRDAAAYLVGWVGMDAAAFMRRRMGAADSAARWIAALAKTMIGAAMVWWAAPIVAGVDAFAGAWFAMIGFILGLHFGLFELNALAWRAVDRGVEPIMDRPLAAASVGEFWGRRWNRAFSDAIKRMVFRPTARRWGVRVASAIVFAVSGVLHELMITVPAGGGYGLPMAYFMLQGVAVEFERSAAGRCVLSTAASRRAFAWLVVGGPAVWLFGPAFVANVAAPFMAAIGAG